MFCYKCGAEIPNESEFCMKCGAKIPLADSDEKLSEPNTAPAIEPFEYNKGSDRVKVEGDKIIIMCYRSFAPRAVHEITYDKIAKVQRLYKGNTLAIIYLYKEKFKECSFYCKDITIANKVFEICDYFSKQNNYNVPETSQPEEQAVIQVNVTAPEPPKEKPLTKHQRIRENKKNGIACCPKCGSTSLSSNKQGFGIGKALIGAAAITNPIGLVAGNINSKKVHVTCLNCGHKWKM